MLCANMKNKYIAQTKNLARSTFCGIAKAVRVCILLSMVVRIIRSRGENMGSPTSEYNQKLRERLLLIKEKARLSNEQIAEFMDCDARHVSRILNGEAKATCEDIAKFAERLPADIDYLLYGKRTSVAKIAQFWVAAGERQLAELHFEMAKFFNTRASILDSKPEQQDDFTINDSEKMEIHKRKK